MKRSNWLFTLGISFLTLSTITYYIHYLIFSDSTYIFQLLIAELAFLPISTLLVTVVLNQLMGKREKTARMQKLNMVIGAFYSDVGTDLLKIFIAFDYQAENIRQELKTISKWENADFDRMKRQVAGIKPDIIPDKSNLVDLKSFLAIKRNTLLRMMENPNLLEHETFSNLLQAVFHLAEELGARGDLSELQASDYAHLRVDSKRVYILLIDQWLDYMQHLRKNYPYLFSLAIRTNPFNPEISIEVTEDMTVTAQQ